jgi:uncharacterized membrane protein
VEDERPLIEKIADALDTVNAVELTVVGVLITAALLIMGNTLARLIGLFFLVLLALGARRFRFWQRN